MKAKIIRRTETVPIQVERHTLNGQPTCCAWAGGGGKRVRVCQFLGGTHFGLRPVCMATGQPLYEEQGLLSPTANCPVWQTKAMTAAKSATSQGAQQ